MKKDRSNFGAVFLWADGERGKGKPDEKKEKKAEEIKGDKEPP